MVWSMDFVSDNLASGRRIQCLTVTGNCRHECVDIAVDHCIGAEYVVCVLNQVALFLGYLQAERTDQGPESQPGLHGVGAGQGRAPTPSTGQESPRRTHTSRASTTSSAMNAQRALVPEPEAGTRGNRSLEYRIQRNQAAQQLWADAASEVCRPGST